MLSAADFDTMPTITEQSERVMSFASEEGQTSGYQGGDAYGATDTATMDAMRIQNQSHTSVAVSNEHLMMAQGQIDGVAASVRARMSGASEAEIQRAVEQAVGSLSLPPQLGQAQISQMTQQAMTRTDSNIMDNTSGQGAGQAASQEQGNSMGMFAGLFAMVAGAYAASRESIGALVERFSPGDRQEVALAGNTLANNVVGFENLGRSGTTQGLDVALDRGPAQTPTVQVAQQAARGGNEGWAISRANS